MSSPLTERLIFRLFLLSSYRYCPCDHRLEEIFQSVAIFLSSILINRGNWFLISFQNQFGWFSFFVLIIYINIPADVYLFKVNNRNTRKRCEICSKLRIKTPKWRLLTLISRRYFVFKHIGSQSTWSWRIIFPLHWGRGDLEQLDCARRLGLNYYQ